MSNIELEQDVIAAAIKIAVVILIYTLRLCTNTACSIEPEQRLCSVALTFEAGLLQNFCAHKK